MTTAHTAPAAERLSLPDRLGRAVGPVFEKELRVSSRRGRTYVLRFVYLAVLTAFVAGVWMAAVGNLDRPSLLRLQSMARAGQDVICGIAWFQMAVLPLLTAGMLSASIREEVTRRTLRVLMATPVTAYQVVLGKLLSRLLYVLLLAGISLPLLVVVRVFGGVPWGFVVRALVCVLTGSALAGSLSLFFATSLRNPYLAFLLTLVVGGWALVALGLVTSVPLMLVNGDLVLYANAAINPWFGLGAATAEMMSPGTGVVPWAVTGLHILVTAAVCAGILKLAAVYVRRQGLPGPLTLQAPSYAAMPAAVALPKPSAGRRATETVSTVSGRWPSYLRRVKGRPLVWIDASVRYLALRIVTIVVAAVLGFVGLLGLVAQMDASIGGRAEIFGTISCVMLAAAALVTALHTAPTLAAEREAGTLALLACLPRGGGAVVLEKALASLKRAGPIWLPLVGFVMVEAAALIAHPLVLPLVGMIGGGTLVLLTGTGLLAGSLARRPATAVVMNLAVLIAVAVGVPTAGGLMGAAGVGDEAAWAVEVNPLAQTWVATEGAVVANRPEGAEGWGGRTRPTGRPYRWPPTLRYRGHVSTAVIVFATSVVQALVGVAAGLWAWRRLEKLGYT